MLVQGGLQGAGDFSEGLVAVKINRNWGYINNNAQLIIPRTMRKSKFINGFAKVKSKKKWGIINTSGELVVPCIYKDIDFAEGNLFRAKLKDKYGHINAEGTIIIPFEYNDMKRASEGLIATFKKDTWVYVNYENKHMFQVNAQVASRFINGTAKIKVKGKFGLINKQGDFVVQPIYDKLNRITDRVLLAEKNKIILRDYYYINDSGKIIFEPYK